MKVLDVVTSSDPRDEPATRYVVAELGVQHVSGTCARVYPQGAPLAPWAYRLERCLRVVPRDVPDFLSPRAARQNHAIDCDMDEDCTCGKSAPDFDPRIDYPERYTDGRTV